MDKDALFTADALGLIEVGDEIQMDIRDDIPLAHRFGMEPGRHSTWTTVARREDYIGSPVYGMQWGVRWVYYDHRYGYGFTILNIKDWRKKKP